MQPGFLEQFRQQETGNMTVLALFFFLSSVMAGSLAVDFANKAHAQRDLQIIADTAAHAAMRTRLRGDSEQAIDAALEIAGRNAVAGRPAGITRGDVVFGQWDAQTRTFTPDPDGRDAVRVTAHRSRTHDNMVEGLLIGVLGFAGFELTAQSVYVAQTHPCATNGIAAEFEVSFTVQNDFDKGFCLRSDREMSFNIGNSFGDGALVLLPYPEYLNLPDGQMDSQGGLVQALDYDAGDRLNMEGIYRAFDAGFRAGEARYLPRNVTFSMDDITDVTGTYALTPEMVPPGQTRLFYCGGRGTLACGHGTFRDLAIWTDCPITFSTYTALEGVTLLQDNADDMAIRAPDGVRLGAQDGCTPGGETIVMTTGGVDIAADLQMFEATIGALGPISFAANPNCMQGAAILSGDRVTGTSSGAFGHCESARHLDWQRITMVQ
jgi:hypothetical protein